MAAPHQKPSGKVSPPRVSWVTRPSLGSRPSRAGGRTLALGPPECQCAARPAVRPVIDVREVCVLEDRKLDGAARHRRGLRVDAGAGGLQGARRAARPGRLAGHDPQRHGRARGRGLHRPAAHQRRAGSRPTRATGSSSTGSRRSSRSRRAERRAIQTFLDGAVDLDDVVSRTVRLLAQLTRQVAVVQYPSLSRSTRAPRRAGAARPRRGCSSC